MVKKLGDFNSIEDKIKQINTLYESYEMSEKEKNLLEAIVKNQKDVIASSSQQDLKIFINKTDSKSIVLNYEKTEYQLNIKEKIKLLNENIKATESLFAYEETKKLFNKLIKLQPTAKNYFDYAYFLQRFNFIDEAIKAYEEALKIYKKLADKNPKTYLSYVAMTLNNLANLHSDKNEFSQALEEYEEALEIRRKLAKENPKTYLSDVAKTLNNLAVLHKAKNELRYSAPCASTCHHENVNYSMHRSQMLYTNIMINHFHMP